MVKVTKKSLLIVTTHVMAVIYTSASFHWNKINIFLIIDEISWLSGSVQLPTKKQKSTP
jgi:hypothetical protein